jgi:hypothetical protein
MPITVRIDVAYDSLMHLLLGGVESNLKLVGHRSTSPTSQQLLTAKDMVVSHDYIANQ